MHLEAETIRRLIAEAEAARAMAYTPYSHFRVGAALLCADGYIVRGCNIENAAYTPTNCAERTAVFAAVAQGRRDFCAIAIVGAPEGIAPQQRGYTAPCGVCRQVLREFVDPAAFYVIMAKHADDYRAATLEELFPAGFGPADLGLSERGTGTSRGAVCGQGTEEGVACGSKTWDTAWLTRNRADDRL